jgi:ABC-type sugar transport system permease subunit
LGLDVYPMLLAASKSLFRVDSFTFEQVWVGLGNYGALFADPEVRASAARSVFFTAGSVAIQTIFGTAFALLLNLPLRGRTVARGLVLFPYLVPGFIVALTFRFILDPVVGVANFLLLSLHVINTPFEFLSNPMTALWFVTMVHGWKFIPFMVIVLLARLQVIPQELYEAAKVDGAGPLQSFWRITLPWLTPVLMIAMLLRTIWTGSDFEIPFLLDYGGPLRATTVVPIEIRSLAFELHDVGSASALAVLAAFAFVGTSVFYLRMFRKSAASIG